MGGWLSVVATVPLQVSGLLSPITAEQEASPPFDPAQPFGIVQEELDSVGERMRTSVESSIPALSHAAGYLLKSNVQGKRLRPALMLMLATALDESPPLRERTELDTRPPSTHPGNKRRCQQRIAEIAEIVHVASLLHDDVIDDASTRRGVKALNIVVGNKLAILAGDFLLARVSVTLASLESNRVIKMISRILEDLVSGEIMQMTSTPEDLLRMDHYLDKTYRKTASLMSNGAKAIAGLEGSSEEVIQLAADYGKYLGLAFQIVDDILDFTENSETLGKPAMNDLRSGLATAPILFAAEEFPELKPKISRKFKEDGDVEESIRLLEKSQGLDKARAFAVEHAEKAANCIRKLPMAKNEHAVVARAALLHLTEMVVKRVK